MRSEKTSRGGSGIAYVHSSTADWWRGGESLTVFMQSGKAHGPNIQVNRRLGHEKVLMEKRG